jgi:hypothetical protein
MKKADNFDATKWLVENKITSQSKLKEDNYNAIDSMAPDWEDEDGYELVLDNYFNTYGLEDPKEFAEEVYNNGDAQNNLAFDIAKRAGFKGRLGDLIKEQDFNRYCNMLAKLFLLNYGAAMGSVDRNDPKYQKEIQLLNTELPKLKSKAQLTIDKLQVA